MQTSFLSIEETGFQLAGAITPFGHLGPKHYGIVIGKSVVDGLVYIAENTPEGYHLIPANEFVERYRANGKLVLIPNSGPYSAIEIANRALQRIYNSQQEKYCLFSNNCESFSSEVVTGRRESQQVWEGIVGCAFAYICFLALKTRSAANSSS